MPDPVLSIVQVINGMSLSNQEKRNLIALLQALLADILVANPAAKTKN